MFEAEIVNAIVDNGAVGVVVLSVFAIMWIVKVFLQHISEQAELSREAHREMSQNSSGALREVTAVVSKLHEGNERAHMHLEHQTDKVLSNIETIKTKLIEK